jgi:predicted phosphodiesterase
VRRALLLAVACGPGNHRPADYPPAALDANRHESATYVAKNLPLRQGILLAHPRLGQPAIRRAGEAVDVGWIDPPPAIPQVAATGPVVAIDGVAQDIAAASCDDAGVCHGAIAAPAALGLHQLCVTASGHTDCSPGALAIVADYPDPLTIAHVSDAHIGADDDLVVWSRVIDAIDAANPDVVVFTGDACDTGRADQRAPFLAQLARLQVPVFAVTGNHDFDAGGIDGWLLDIGPELDYAQPVGGIQLVGLSTGQDLDDDEHETTLSESDGPDNYQLAWADATIGDTPTIAFFHHPIFNPLFATVGPDARDRLKSIVSRSSVRAVLAGHTHASAVFDADGNSRGLSLDADTVAPERWPLHYIASRATRDPGGFAVLHAGTTQVDYRWVELR